jgi:ribonuclease Z
VNRFFSFRNLEPTFFAGLLDDPLLLIRVRSAGQNLLFDCGQIHHLAKRVLTALKAVFISHTHMDHWMGIDSVVRHLHASPRTLELFGPPGLAEKFAHKLAGYDWNLAEQHWADFRVQEIYPDRLEIFVFSGPEGFKQIDLPARERTDPVIYQDQYLRVSATSCEHRVTSLVFRIDEQPTFLLDPLKLEQLNLAPGPWLGELKKYYFQRQQSSNLQALQKTAEGTAMMSIADPEKLLQQLQRPQTLASIGYISDIGYTPKNRRRIADLLQGVTLLVSECTFLGAAKDKARRSFHLCTEDINQLLAEIKPDYFLPMHLSKTYSRHIAELYRELQPPAETTLLTLPARRTARPLQLREIDWQIAAAD